MTTTKETGVQEIGDQTPRNKKNLAGRNDKEKFQGKSSISIVRK